jgi:uncharacterized repeat protein (TIGR03803 family)
LYSFRDKQDGSAPFAAPIRADDGNFYGTSSSCVSLVGGCQTTNANKFGAVYKITPDGKFTTLHDFDGRNGANPLGQLVQATDGKFYGTTLDGGANNLGTLFRISASGKFKLLFNFDSEFGEGPLAGLIQGNDGNLRTVLIFFIAGLLFLCLEHVDYWERIASRWRPAFSSHLVSSHSKLTPKGAPFILCRVTEH